jgi:hypothetical protein
LAEGANDASACRVDSVVDVWRLLGPDNPRWTGGGRSWQIVIGSAFKGHHSPVGVQCVVGVQAVGVGNAVALAVNLDEVEVVGWSK